MNTMNISNTDDRQEIYNRKHVNDVNLSRMMEMNTVYAEIERKKKCNIKNHKNHK